MLDSLLGMLLARLHVTFLRFGELLHTMSLRTMTGNVRRHRDSITKEEHATHESFIQVKGLSVSLYCILHKNGQIEKAPTCRMKPRRISICVFYRGIIGEWSIVGCRQDTTEYAFTTHDDRLPMRCSFSPPPSSHRHHCPRIQLHKHPTRTQFRRDPSTALMS